MHDRFVDLKKINPKSLREVAGVRGVTRLARTALNDYDWGHNARNKMGAALVSLLLDTARIKVPGIPGTSSSSEDEGDEDEDEDEDEMGLATLVGVPGKGGLDWGEEAGNRRGMAEGEGVVGGGAFGDAYHREESEEPELFEVPAFYHSYVFHKGQKYGTIAWHEAFYQFMDDEHLIRATLQPVRYMPMVRGGRLHIHTRVSPPYFVSLSVFSPSTLTNHHLLEQHTHARAHFYTFFFPGICIIFV